MEKEELWQAALAKIELDLSRPSFLTWFQETGIVNVHEGVATVCTPNVFVKEWLRNKYHKIILHALRAITPDIRDLTYVIGRSEDSRIFTSFKDYDHSVKKKKLLPVQFMEDALQIKDLTVNPTTSLNPRYTFDTFIVGSFNELAHAAAQSVVKSPGLSYNPFFVYSVS